MWKEVILEENQFESSQQGHFLFFPREIVFC